MDTVFHYPPEFLQLLVNTIPLLCPSKKDVFSFLRGAGVDRAVIADLEKRFQENKDSISKYEIVRTVLNRLNERGDSALRERREIVRRVVEFEDFSTCWPADQVKAKGFVAEVRRVQNVKDSFTRMDSERERERKQRLEEKERAAREKLAQRERLRDVYRDLVRLFGEPDKQKRGKALEDVLNRLFKVSDVLVTEAFAVRGEDGEGVVEQIDGVILFDGNHYLVEMKWIGEALDVGEVSRHLVRVYHRGQARGIMISTSGYTKPAITTCREALQKSVFVLAELDEIVALLEHEVDLKAWLKEKIDVALSFKNPLHRPSLDT